MGRLVLALSLPVVVVAALVGVVWAVNSRQPGDDLLTYDAGVNMTLTCEAKVEARHDVHVMYGRVMYVGDGDLSDIAGLAESTRLLVAFDEFKPGLLFDQATPDEPWTPVYTRSVSVDNVDVGNCVVVVGRERLLTCGTDCVDVAFWADEVRVIPLPY
jgi:hypothetical protein